MVLLGDWVWVWVWHIYKLRRSVSEFLYSGTHEKDTSDGTRKAKGKCHISVAY